MVCTSHLKQLCAGPVFVIFCTHETQKMHTAFWNESLKEINDFRGLAVHGSITLRRTSKQQYVSGAEWSILI